MGVNKFAVEEKNTVPGFKIDDSIRQIQVDKLTSLKIRRDNAKATNSLDAIIAAAVDGSNLMPFVIEAVENYCTLGEIADTLRMVWGEYK